MIESLLVFVGVVEVIKVIVYCVVNAIRKSLSYRCFIFFVNKQKIFGMNTGVIINDGPGIVIINDGVIQKRAL